MSNQNAPHYDKTNLSSFSGKGETFETRQSGADPENKEEWIPDPSKSLSLPPARQRLFEDVMALYTGQATVERIRRYTPDAVYDDPYSYANDRYQIAAQWFTLPKIFKCENNSYEIVRNDDEVLQFKNQMTWTPHILPKSVTLNSLVTISLDPETAKSDHPLIKYHKDQATARDYTHTGIKHKLKEWQAKGTAWLVKEEGLKPFEQDYTGSNRESVNVYRE